MPSLCRDNPAQCQRIADVLTQLMQSDDANELSLVNMSLVTLLKTNAKGLCFFAQYCMSANVCDEPV